MSKRTYITEKVVENEVSDEVTDEVCANIEYEAKIQESKESEIYQFECWDPRNKWEIQDVFNHMGETLEQMFQVFKVNSEDQQYQLDVDEKINESFKVKLEMKKFKNLKAVIDNFRRQGYVKGGGCVKFENIRKIL